MGAAPVVEEGGVTAVAVVDVAGELEVERAAGEVFEGRVDEVDADFWVVEDHPKAGILDWSAE